jgi:hypothetical protein
MNKYVSKLFNALNISTDTPTAPSGVTSYKSLNNDELVSFIQGIYVPEKVATRSYEDMSNMLEPVSKLLSDQKVDNAKLLAIAPEIEQAASILIPSILSPNDFNKNRITLVIEESLESNVTVTQITKHLTDHFSEKLELTTRLSEWLNDAIFNIGSKVILTLPTNVVNGISDIASVEDISDYLGSTEELKSTNDTIKDIRQDDTFFDNICSIEGISEVLKPMYKGTSQHTQLNVVRKSITSGVDKLVSLFDDTDLLSFTDNPMSIIQSDVDVSVALESLSSELDAKFNNKPAKPDKKEIEYKQLSYIDLGDILIDENPGYPSIIELPSESVIPIIVDGAPSNHIGYFVLLNSNGIPISTNVDDTDALDTTGSGSTRVNTMYQSVYGTSYSSVQKRVGNKVKSDILNTVYNSYLDKIIDNKLKGLGLANFEVELSNDIGRVMFSRLLRKTKTKILFIPKHLITYIAYDYNSNGTGRSKIDQIKFPLSLKMTLIITRLISLIESSINYRKINIELNDDVGNPIEVMRTIKKEILKNKSYGISYDPSTIVKSSIDKQYTIVPTNIPGVTNFSIEDEDNSVSYPTPDDSLIEEITNMYTLGLGVPPSAMNRLKEDEYSRSVASNNIFFSNKLRMYQKPTIEFVTKLMSTYIHYSDKLQDDIRDILKNSTESDDKMKALDDRMSDVIDRLKFTLPSPNIAQDKSLFEELEEFINMIDTVLDKIYSDDLTSDRDLQDTIKSFRAFVRRELINNHLKTDSMFGSIDFGDINNPDIAGIVKNNMLFANMDKATKDLKEKLSGGGDSGGGSDW